MRIWTVHPQYLDAKGLVALWRETLLAQKVLQGQTKGYTKHPQLTRFRVTESPVTAVAAYLQSVAEEATQRGYNFDASKISTSRFSGQLDETEGQLLYEWHHLLEKLKKRDPERFETLKNMKKPTPHPLFRIVPGPVQDWEIR